MQILLSLLKWSLIALLTFAAYFFYKFYIRLWIDVWRYKQMDPTLKVLVRPLTGLQQIQKECREKYGDSHYFIKEMMRQNPDQKAYLTNLGDRTFLLLTDLDLIKYLCLNHKMFEKLKLFKHMDLSYLKSIFFAEAEEWKAQRQLVGPGFNHQHLTRTIPTMKKVIVRFMDGIKKRENKVFHVLDQSEVLLGQVLVRTFFSNQIADKKVQGHSITLALAEFTAMMFFRSGTASNLLSCQILGEWARNLNFGKEDKELLKLIVEIREVLFELVENRLKNPTTEFDFLEIYITEMKRRQTMKKEAEEKGEKPLLPLISKEEAVQQLISFYFAGIDTTGHLLAFMLYTAAEYPHLAKKLEEEIDKWIPNEQALQYEILNKLEYMEMYIKECLRMWPPAVGVLARVAKQDMTIGPYQVKKGSCVGTNIIGACHNPKYWKNPDLFDPDRWLDKDQLSEQPYAFTPFSAGPRACIGKGLSIMEAKIIMTYFMKTFTIKRTDVPFRMTAKFLYEPLDGNLVRLQQKLENAW